MACDTVIPVGKTSEQRKAEVKAAVDRLKAAIMDDTVKIVVDKKTGAVAFAGWEDRKGVTDACAFRRLKNSSEVRMKILRAEMTAGVKVNEKAVLAGVHSHDGGKTFGPGHK